MRKPELAAAIAEKADLTKDQANRVLNAVLDEITNALNRKDSVTLVGFGTFLQRHRGARTGKNPQTGEPVTIKASVTLVGFGTFLQRHRGARTGKNPQTGEPVTIKASNTVAFKPGKMLKDAIN